MKSTHFRNHQSEALISVFKPPSLKNKITESVVLSLGSNLKNRRENLHTALVYLQNTVIIKRMSSIYESSAVDYAPQPSFLNICVEIYTSLKPHLLLSLTQQIEKKMKRQKAIPKGPRNIDIDIIFYKDKIIKTPLLQIPHPHYTQRRFVLLPLLEIFGNRPQNCFDPESGQNLYFYHNKNFHGQVVKHVNQLFEVPFSV